MIHYLTPMRVLLAITFTLLPLSGARVLAQEGSYDHPGRPDTHGSLINGGSPATVEVLVVGCQGFAVENAAVVLVGEAVAENRGAGVYVFPEVPAREQPYRLYVFNEAGTASDTALHVDPAAAYVRAEVMLDMCIETVLTTYRGVVRDAAGKPAPSAAVAIPELFLETAADDRGRYELNVPPGEWILEARGGEDSTRVPIKPAYPEDPGGQRQEIYLDLQLP